MRLRIAGSTRNRWRDMSHMQRVAELLYKTHDCVARNIMAVPSPSNPSRSRRKAQRALFSWGETPQHVRRGESSNRKNTGVRALAQKDWNSNAVKCNRIAHKLPRAHALSSLPLRSTRPNFPRLRLERRQGRRRERCWLRVRITRVARRRLTLARGGTTSGGGGGKREEPLAVVGSQAARRGVRRGFAGRGL